MTDKTINLPALAKRVAGDWQPMETAPLHESLLMQMKHGIIEGSYDGDVGFGYYWSDMEWYPTAWMPLPDAAHTEAEIIRLFGPVVERLTDTLPVLDYIAANSPIDTGSKELAALIRQTLADLAAEGGA